MPETSPRLIVIVSPFSGDVEKNQAYLQRCLRDSLLRGEAPYASHALYPGALDDSVPAERAQGMAAGHAWLEVADAVAVYTDLGISTGMADDLGAAQRLHIPIEKREIGNA